MVGGGWIGSLIELAAGLSVTGVRAGLGRITAYPSGRLGVLNDAVSAKSLALEAGPLGEDAKSPALRLIAAVVGEGRKVGD
jgi:hypothetical protein